jgi:hypothetical protein
MAAAVFMSLWISVALRKILTVDTVTADLQMVCRHRDQPEFVHGVHLHAVHVQVQDDELFPIAVRSKECNTSRAIDCQIWWISKHEVVYRTRFCGLLIAFRNRRYIRG